MRANYSRNIFVIDIDTDDASRLARIAEVSEREQTATAEVSNLDNHIRLHGKDEFLVNPKIERVLKRLDSEISRAIDDARLHQGNKIVHGHLEVLFEKPLARQNRRQIRRRSHALEPLLDNLKRAFCPGRAAELESKARIAWIVGRFGQ